MSCTRPDESLGGRRGAKSFQIHGQKSHIGGDITVTELVVELETIENPGPVVKAIDVASLKIAVAVTDLVSGNAGREQRSATGQIAIDFPYHFIVRTRLKNGPDETSCRGHVGFELTGHRFDRGRVRNGVRSVGPGMKSRQSLSYRS